MKKMIVITMCCIGLIVAGISFTNKKYRKKIGEINRIAIFEPITHPAIYEIEQAFVNELQHKMPCKCIVYNAQGNKTLVRGQAEEILQQGYDLIFTIGASCTQTIYELCSKKQKNIPVVFCSIDDPMSMGIVKSLASSGNNLTGVIETTNYEKQVECLLAAKPTVKNVLLAYDPTHGTGCLEKDKLFIQELLKKYAITLQSVEIFHANELQQKVSGFLTHVDTILVLKDNTVVAGVDVLVKLCNQYGVTLYVSDLNSGLKGAALSYGIKEGDSGIQAAQKALLVLQKHKQPNEISITPVLGDRLVLNTSTCSQQGLEQGKNRSQS